MPLLDIVFIAAVLISVLAGVFKGFMREILSLFFFVLSVYLAYTFYEPVGVWLQTYISRGNVASFVAFIVIFAVVIICGSIISWFARKLVVGPLKAADRMLGAAFGLIRGVLIAGIILYLMVVFKIGTDEIGKSRTVPYITYVMDAVLDMLPDEYHIKESTTGENISVNA